MDDLAAPQPHPMAILVNNLSPPFPWPGRLWPSLEDGRRQVEDEHRHIAGNSPADPRARF
jgi:hypothetical protein